MRILLETLAYRTLAVTADFLVLLLLTGKPSVSVAGSFATNAVKMLLYYSFRKVIQRHYDYMDIRTGGKR